MTALIEVALGCDPMSLRVRREHEETCVKKAPVGAGPYRFVSFTPGVELVLEAHGTKVEPAGQTAEDLSSCRLWARSGLAARLAGQRRLEAAAAPPHVDGVLERTAADEAVPPTVRVSSEAGC